MAWIESHEEIGDHHKTLKLAELLKCSIPTAVGHLHLLWHYTLKVAWRDGDLSKFTPGSISRACWWEGGHETFISALRESKWLDGDIVHDWQEYAKHIIYQRFYNENKRKDLTAVKKLQNSQNTPATIPNLTIPNLKNMGTPKKGASFQKPTPEEAAAYALSLGFKLDGRYFVDFYETRGWMAGKSKMRDWKAAVRTWKRNQIVQTPNTPKIRSSEETQKLLKELASE